MEDGTFLCTELRLEKSNFLINWFEIAIIYSFKISEILKGPSFLKKKLNISIFNKAK